ncbi:hypothetical protein ACTSKR_00595 [Chitinibacteraceae bacterium HSL-7]
MIYWTLARVPELSGLPRNERLRRWRAAYRRTFGHWQTWLALLMCVILSACAGWLGLTFGSSTLALVFGALGGGLGGLLFSQIAIRVARRHYADILSGR